MTTKHWRKAVLPAALALNLIALSTMNAWGDDVKKQTAQASHNHSIAEFSAQEDLSWSVVDDGVMGGLSKGKADVQKNGTLHFRGTLSLENNGGFSSVRTERVRMDMSAADGIVVRVKGDGRTYQLRLATDALYRGREISFKADFSTKDGQWIEVKIPFTAFKGTFRGLSLPEREFDPNRIQRVWLLLGDKKAGPFDLKVDWIRSYSAST